MKKFFFFLLLVIQSGMLLAQTSTDSTKASQIQFKDKSKLKAVGVKQTSNVGSEHSESNEPVIIMHLEYNSSDASKIEVKTEEVKQVEVQTETTNGSSEQKQVMVNSKSEPEVKTVEEQILILDGHINAIDTKVNSVKNNPEEDKKAKKSGWYEQMAKNRKDAIAKREALINSQK